MAKKFERKCHWCGRSFNHWRSHWIHEKNCVKQEFVEDVPMIPALNVLNTPEEPSEDFDDSDEVA